MRSLYQERSDPGMKEKDIFNHLFNIKHFFDISSFSQIAIGKSEQY